MKVIVKHRGHLSFDIRRPAKTRPDASGAQGEAAGGEPTIEVLGLDDADVGLDLNAFGSVDEALFAGLIFLLQRYHARARSAPPFKIVGIVIDIFDELLTRGELPKSTPYDNAFLGKLLVVLERFVEKAARLNLATLIEKVRKGILNEEWIEDDEVDGRDGGNGVGGDENGEDDSLGGVADQNGCEKSGSGNNGTPGNGA